MPTTTPLTDAIEALTTYSNTVTGASDTTLSEAVATLASGYGGGGGYSVTDIIDRTPIIGDVTYSGTRTTLPFGCLSNSEITSFTSTTVTNSEQFAFYNCKKLKTVDLPNFSPNATNKAGSMFTGCSALESINIPKYKRSGTNFLQYCSSLQTIVLPAVDYTLQGYFANGCTSLTAVDIGKNVGGSVMAGNCFSSTGIKTLILRRTAAINTLASTNNFSNSPMASGGSGGTIYVPSALKSTYQSASNWSSLNVTWESIEGSYYETHYADGTLIPTT